MVGVIAARKSVGNAVIQHISDPALAALVGLEALGVRAEFTQEYWDVVLFAELRQTGKVGENVVPAAGVDLVRQLEIRTYFSRLPFAAEESTYPLTL